MTKYTIIEKATGKVLISKPCPSTVKARERKQFNTDLAFYADVCHLSRVWFRSNFHRSIPNNTPIEQDGFIFEFKDES